MTVAALNVILRWPGERFQPYIGAGPGVFFVDASNSLGSTSDTKLGFNGLAGLKVFLTRNVGLYGEYKYNNAKFAATYEAHMLVGGLAFHFSP